MTTIHNHAQEATSGCKGHNCKKNRYVQQQGNGFENVMIAAGVFGALTNSVPSIFNQIRQNFDFGDTENGGATSNILGNSKLSVEDIDKLINEEYTKLGVADDAELAGKVEEAKTACEQAQERISGDEGFDKQIETAKNDIKTLNNNIKTTKQSLSEAEKNLKTAKSSLAASNPEENQNHQQLVEAVNAAELAKTTAEKNLADLEKTLSEKEASLNKLEGAKKQADAELKTRKEQYNTLVNAQKQIKLLKDDLEKAKVREAKEEEDKAKAEEKRKKEETIENLSNGDTAAISKLLKKIRNAESLNFGKREEKLREQLDAALEEYYKTHKIGDNRTIDGLPEAKRFQEEEKRTPNI